MANKKNKDFSQIGNFITQDEQITSKKSKTQKEQDTQDEQITSKSKLQRINMAFSDKNILYLRDMSSFLGISMTAYVNKILEEDEEKNKEKITLLRELRK